MYVHHMIAVYIHEREIIPTHTYLNSSLLVKATMVEDRNVLKSLICLFALRYILVSAFWAKIKNMK